MIDRLTLHDWPLLTFQGDTRTFELKEEEQFILVDVTAACIQMQTIKQQWDI